MNITLFMYKLNAKISYVCIVNYKNEIKNYKDS